ncbi:MAG TPA: AAA family ATPase [Bacteroidales bacterium]|nr:AAA family ATPase [Bacteroidales bacterium]
MATLKYGVVDQKGFLLVTGDVGTGKTTLINALLTWLGNDVIVANITNPILEEMDFFNIVADQFNINKYFSRKADFLIHFSRFLNDCYTKKKKVILVIDEAHKLDQDLLEQIRLFSNIEKQHTKLINIFFVGQNEFIDIISDQQNRALRQRITINYHLDPLKESEVKKYILHRLNVAGLKENIFSDNSIREIHSFSNGYPRRINIICDHALLTGFARDLKKITPAIIKECSQELSFPGETKKNAPSNFPYQQSYYEHSPHLVKHPFENEVSIEKENQTNQDSQAISFQQAESTKESIDLRKHNKENVNKDFIESSIVRKRKNLLLWISAVTFAVIVMILIWPSNKNRFLKENGQKPVASVLTVHTSSPIKTDNNFSSLTSKDRDALTMPALSKSVAQNDKSKTNDTVRFSIVSKDKDDIVKAENTRLNPAQDRVLPGRYTAYLHYSNEKNKKIMEELAIFLKNKGFKVNGITRVNYKNRDIRYFHSVDKSGALILKKYLTQFITPYTHFENTNIKILNLSHKYPNAKKGALELWVKF